jgi:hypothetical protein
MEGASKERTCKARGRKEIKGRERIKSKRSQGSWSNC